MHKRCFLLICRNDLLRDAMMSLLIGMPGPIDVFETAASDVDGLLHDVSHIDPDMILLEETSPLSKGSCLFHVLTVKPGRPVVVVSQEHNWIHVVRWQTVQIKSASELINTIRLV